MSWKPEGTQASLEDARFLSAFIKLQCKMSLFTQVRLLFRKVSGGPRVTGSSTVKRRLSRDGSNTLSDTHASLHLTSGLRVVVLSENSLDTPRS